MSAKLKFPHQNPHRNKSINFRVSDKEYEWIKRRQGEPGITNMKAYLLKMAVDGRAFTVELDSVNECSRLLRNVSNNINQIAVRVNSTGNIYAADIADIQVKQAEIWNQQNVIIQLLTDIVEVA